MIKFNKERSTALIGEAMSLRVCRRCEETSNFDEKMCFWCMRETNTPESELIGEEEAAELAWGVFRTPSFDGELGCMDAPIKVFKSKKAAHRAATKGITFGHSRYFVRQVVEGGLE